MATALYPGSFDPVTVGHLDVIRRGHDLFDKLVVAIGVNREKRSLFTVEERLEMLRTVLAEAQLAVEVAPFEGLVIDFARRVGARCLLRGVRSAGDFDYELSMAQMNRHLAPEIETLFVMPSLPYAFVSARLVRETGGFGADLTGLVPESIRSRIAERLRGERRDDATPKDQQPKERKPHGV